MTGKKLRLLITGHTGFIGQAFLRHMQSENRLEWVGRSFSGGCDLTQAGALDDVGPCDVVLHLASRSGVPAAWQAPDSFYRTNVTATLTVAEYARRTGARIIALSSYMYGEQGNQPIDEATPTSCRNPYAWSKRLAEMVLEGYASDFGTSTTILRLFNLYGEGQPDDWLIPKIIRQALEGDEIQVETLTPKRDFLWIDDLCDALMRAIEQPLSGCNIFNLGFGESHSVREAVEAVCEVIGPRRIVDLGRSRPNEISDCICDSGKFRRTFGWHPHVDFREGISRLVAARSAVSSS